MDVFLSRETQDIIREDGYVRLPRGVHPPTGWSNTRQDYPLHTIKLDMFWLSGRIQRLGTWRRLVVPGAPQ